MRENGKATCGTVLACRNGQIRLATKESGEIIRQTEKENFGMSMVIYVKHDNPINYKLF